LETERNPYGDAARSTASTHRYGRAEPWTRTETPAPRPGQARRIRSRTTYRRADRHLKSVPSLVLLTRASSGQISGVPSRPVFSILLTRRACSPVSGSRLSQVAWGGPPR